MSRVGGWKTASCFAVARAPVRPSGPCCFGVEKAPFVTLGGWKTDQTASFLVGSESDVARRPGPSLRALPSLWKMFTAGTRRVPTSLSPRGQRQGA